jgi:hypothetical protein
MTTYSYSLQLDNSEIIVLAAAMDQMIKDYLVKTSIKGGQSMDALWLNKAIAVRSKLFSGREVASSSSFCD